MTEKSPTAPKDENDRTPQPAPSRTLRLGVIGLSDGNGHPYSWSAIFNGYERAPMEECGFPVIPRYLEKQQWPEDAIAEAKVTHVWTQDPARSRHVAAAARIAHVVEHPEEMIGAVDGILLARDDAETHYQFAAPFLAAGLPVYIDKPVCLSLNELDRLYGLQQFPGQLFTCSAIRYGREFQLADPLRAKLGKLRHIHATTPKDWEKYGVHVIEPLLKLAGDQGRLARHQTWRQEDATMVHFIWESGFQATVSALGKSACPLGLRLIGDAGWHDMTFADAFFAFKAALMDFVAGVINRDVRSDPRFVRQVVEMIEAGRTK